MYQKFIDRNGGFERAKLKAALDVLNENLSVAIDVGASVGLYSRELAKRSQLVIAIEPLNISRACIYRNLPPSCNNVIILPFIICKDRKQKEIFIDENAVGGTTSQPDQIGRITRKDLAQSIRLDDVLNYVGDKKIDFVKIDVQGLELEVLESGLRLLQKHLPVFLIETSSSFSSLSIEIETFFSNQNYSCAKRVGRDAVYTPNLY